MSELGFNVTVTLSIPSETILGLADWNAPLVVVSMMAASQPGITVDVVAVASGTDWAEAKPLVALAVWAESVMLVPVGISACQSNSRQTGNWPEAHCDWKSKVNVTGEKAILGTGGSQLSGDTQAERSNSMNSSAFSWPLRSPFLHVSGNMLPEAEQARGESPTQLLVAQRLSEEQPWQSPETQVKLPQVALLVQDFWQLPTLPALQVPVEPHSLFA